MYCRYNLILSKLGRDSFFGDHTIDWNTHCKSKHQYLASLFSALGPDTCIFLECSTKGINVCEWVGHTETQTYHDGLRYIVHTLVWTTGGPQYDWTFMEYVFGDSENNDISKFYPSLVLDFLKSEKYDLVFAIVQTSSCELHWEDHTNNGFLYSLSAPCLTGTILLFLCYPLFVPLCYPQLWVWLRPVFVYFGKTQLIWFVLMW